MLSSRNRPHQHFYSIVFLSFLFAWCLLFNARIWKVLLESSLSVSWEVSTTDISTLSIGHNSHNSTNHKQIDQKPTIPQIAHVVSITSCHEMVVDGSAVLAESIRQAHEKDKDEYQHNFVSFLTPAEQGCQDGLERVGFKVMVKDDLPFSIDEIQDPISRSDILEGKGCCGVHEYLKLYAFTLIDYDVVFHYDVDVIVLQSLRPLINLLLAPSPSKEATTEQSRHLSRRTAATAPFSGTMNHPQRSNSSNPVPTIPSNYRVPEMVDFLYTRDYNQLTSQRLDMPDMLYSEYDRQTNAMVQGAFFALRPNLKRFNDMLHVIRTVPYHRMGGGWGGQGMFGPSYWGAAQIQGFFAFFYHYLHNKTIVELNPCRYNTMGHDLRFFDLMIGLSNPKMKQKVCRTGEPVSSCEDCSQTPVHEIYVGHLSLCRKPWWCPKWMTFDDERLDNGMVCSALMRRWFRIRHRINKRHDLPVPPVVSSSSNRWYKVSLGYCQSRGKKGYTSLARQLSLNLTGE